MKTAIKRREEESGLDDLFGYGVNDVESTGRMTCVSNPLMDEVLALYNKHLNDDSSLFVSLDFEQVLSPEEIRHFLKITKSYSNFRDYNPRTGEFVSRLVQNSYGSGNNHFSFNLEGFEKIKFLFSKLFADYKNPIKIYVKGDCGSFLCDNSININIAIKGNVGNFGMSYSSSIKAAIKGDCEVNYGYGSKKLKTYLDGEFNSSLYQDIKKGFRSGDYAKNSRFYKKMMGELEARLE